MSIDRRQPWFHAKKNGLGWSLPLTWQGWLVLATYFVLLTIGVIALRDWHPALIFIYFMLISLMLIVVCWLKGEKPVWRRGDK